MPFEVINMKIVALALVALVGVVALCTDGAEAWGNTRWTTQRPPRFRRQAVGGSLVSNPNGGADAKLELAHGIGSPDHNLIGTVFAAGNTDHGPVATGGSVAYNNGPLGAVITQQHVPGVQDTITQALNANLFNDGVNRVDANVFKSENTLANGFKFERNGQGIDYSHINGHGLGLTHSTIPNIGSQIEATGRANLWSSMDGNTRVDLTALLSRWTGGSLNGENDYAAKLGVTHLFG